MRGAVWHAARDVRIEEVAEPAAEPAEGQVLVEVSIAGICASDVAEYRDGPHMIPVGRPHPLTGRTAPVVLGHEYSGRVAAVGAGVAGLAVGDRVCGDACIRCGHCYWCLRGEYNICEVGAAIGLQADGAFAPLLEVPAYSLCLVPDAVTDRSAAVVEPLAVGLHALGRGRFRPGDTVVVLGYGMIGAGVAAIARVTGAGQVVVVEPNEHRAALAAAMGATEVLPGVGDGKAGGGRSGRGDLRREIQARTGGVGADLVIDCTGVPALLGPAVEAARRGGTVVLCGIGHLEAPLTPSRLVYFERSVVGALGYRYDHAAVVALLADGRLDIDPLLGEPIPLSGVVSDGLERMLRDPACPLRVPVTPGVRG